MQLAGFQKPIIRDTYDNLATFDSLPVANGKTTLLGAVGLERICRGDDYAEVDVLATKRGQAGEVVGRRRAMAEACPELRERCALYDDDTELRYRPTGSRLRAHPARLKSLEGLNFNLGIVDEVGFAQDEHIESLLARLGKRPDAHLLGIGTPGFEPNMLWRLRRDSDEGDAPRRTSLPRMGRRRRRDVPDRRAWRIANPAIAAGFLSPPLAGTPSRTAAGGALPHLPPRAMGRPVRSMAARRRLGILPARRAARPTGPRSCSRSRAPTSARSPSAAATLDGQRLLRLGRPNAPPTRN